METNKNQYKEPFKPEDTPTPPQSMHPGQPDKNENVSGDKHQQRPKSDNKGESPKKKLLGESETEIDDETTI